MKSKIKLLMLSCLFCLIPISSFALVDINAYGGYTIGGDLNGRSVKIKGSDLRYGFSAHLNKDFLVFIKLGLGGFYQASSVSYKLDKARTADKQSAGIEAYALFDLPMLPLAPYAKFNTAAWNKIDFLGRSDSDYFKRHGFGLGAAFTLLPIPTVMSLQLFAEYVYAFGKEMKHNSNEHQINLGLRADFF